MKRTDARRGTYNVHLTHCCIYQVEAIVWHVARLDKMREEIASG
jgi:hypothetical protein